MAGHLHISLLLLFRFAFLVPVFSIPAEVSGVEFISTRSLLSEGGHDATVVPPTDEPTSRTIIVSEEERPKPERRRSRTQAEDEAGPLELGEHQSSFISKQKELFDDNKYIFTIYVIQFIYNKNYSMMLKCIYVHLLLL